MLLVTPEQFEYFYNYNITPHVEEKQDLLYLSWSFTEKMMRTHFPTYQLKFKENDFGNIIWKVNLNINQNRDYTERKIEELKVEVADAQEAASACTNYSDKKVIDKKIRTLESDLEYYEAILYDNFGYYFVTYIYDTESEQSSEEFYFPIMDNRKASCTPDARNLTDNIQRAGVKTWARFCGIGLRLWSMEGVKEERKDKELSSKYNLLKKIHSLLQRADEANITYEVPDFSWSVTKIQKLGDTLKSQLSSIPN